MSVKPTPAQVLNTPMDDNDADADTIREYLIELLTALWAKGSNFSSKRPFGSSSWCYELYRPLAKAGYVKATFDEDGYLADMSGEEQAKADNLITDAIKHLGEVPL